MHHNFERIKIRVTVFLKWTDFKGGFFSERTAALVISLDRWTFYFPELKNFNFWSFKAVKFKDSLNF